MKFLVLICLFILSSQNAALAQQETHGGDGFATEFFSLYSDLRSQIPSGEIHLANGQVFAVAALDKIRPLLTVVSYPHVIWDGKEVSARNTPAKHLIELSQTHWLLLNYEQKISLVLHEVLPVAGWVDDDYTVSSALLKKIDLQQARSSITTLATALLSCNTGALQSMSAGLYQSFLPATRADFIHLGIMASCDYFLAKAVEFSSSVEVQTTCDTESNETPFEGLVGIAMVSSVRNEARLMNIFKLLFTRPEDRKLSCRLGNRLAPRGTMCDVLKKYQNPNDALLNNFSKQIGCR